MKEGSPTVVFAWGEAGQKTAAELARQMRGSPVERLIAIWMVHDRSGNLEARALHRDAVLQIVQPASGLKGLITTAVEELLTLGEPEIAKAAESRSGLRLVLLVAAQEIEVAKLGSFAAAFHAVGYRHAGARYLTEACLLVPNLATSDKTVLDPLHELSQTMASQDEVLDRFLLCWWLGRVNVHGLVLPQVHDVEHATVLRVLLETPPEHLPLSQLPHSRGPNHLSAGYAELGFRRSELAQVLSGRYGSSLIERFLSAENEVDVHDLRRHAWQIMSGVAETLEQVELDTQGTRVWSGFQHQLPEIVVDPHELIAELRSARESFVSQGLPRCRAAFEQSARSQLARLRARLTAESHDLGERASGGLFATKLLLEEIVTFLIDMGDVREGEMPMNLQRLRRDNDRTLTTALGIEALTTEIGRAQEVSERQRALAELLRLRDISQPPALRRELFQKLRWQGAGSLDDKIVAASAELEAATLGWIQEVVDSEERTQHAFHHQGLEAIARCEKEIAEAESELRKSTAEHRRQTLALVEMRRGPWYRRSGSRLQQLNDRLIGAEHEVRVRARQVLACCSARMQLSVTVELHAIRDRMLRQALDHVGALHGDIKETLKRLKSLQQEFETVSFSPEACTLRRSLVNESNFEDLLRSVDSGSSLGKDRGDSFFADACSATAERVESFRQEARRPFASVITWSITDLLRALKPSRDQIEAWVSWLKATCQPLSPPVGSDYEDYALVRVAEDTRLAAGLRQALPAAVVIDDPESPTVRVLCIRTFSRWEPSILGIL